MVKFKKVLIFIMVLSVCFGLYCRAEAYGEFLLTGDLELNDKDFTVYLNADHAGGIRGGEGNILFDSSLLKVRSLSLQFPEGFSFDYELTPGNLRFIFWGKSEISGSGILFSVNFEIRSGNSDDTVSVKLENGIITDGYTDIAYPDSVYTGVLKVFVTEPPETEPPQTTAMPQTEPITTQPDTSEILTSPVTTAEITAEKLTTAEQTTYTVTTDIITELITSPQTTQPLSHRISGSTVVPIIAVTATLAAVFTAIYIIMKTRKKPNK